MLLPGATAAAQTVQPGPQAPLVDEGGPYQGRPVREVRFEGLTRSPEQFIRNQVRTAPGQPLDWAVVREDLRRLERLGEFSDIQADLLVDDALNVVVVYRLTEAPIVQDVVVVGNRQIPDEEISNALAGTTSLFRGIPIDEFQLGRAQRLIEDLYRRKGYYQVQVTVDRSELETSGVVVFRVREGERLRVTAIRFDGNRSFPSRTVQSNISTRTAGILDSGALSDEGLQGDVESIINFYRDRGFLDVRASYQIQPSPNGREAIITFLIDEGSLYSLRELTALVPARAGDGAALTVFSQEQIRGISPIKPGDTYSRAEVRRAIDAVADAYRKLGYLDAQVQGQERRDSEQPLVDLELLVVEGRRFKTGMVYIQGNTLTQQKVVRREVTIKPDRWLDGTEARRTEQRLREGRLFEPSGVKVTVQPEDASLPGYRDVLIEVEETNTGTLSFGAAVNSDAGLSGVVTLNQRNFDVADWPESFDELVRGRAFRGGGQIFNLTLQPGTESSLYSVSLTEPWLFDRPYSLSGALFFREREYDEYDEERYGVNVSLARRFGTRWSGALDFRAENVDISNVDSRSAADLFAVQGENILTAVGFSLRRTTLDTRFRPTSGAISEFGIEQFGALGGDYDFTRLTAQHQVYIPLDEDFLGRKTVLTINTRIGYIPRDEDDVPIFERFFLGGRTFRGFDFRGIGPEGLRLDGTDSGDKVGGTWSFFAGLQVEKPLWQELIAIVGFLDTGTLTNEPGFDDYRVAVGVGFRLYLPQLGPAPLAFDFGFPIVKKSSDDERLFSFSIDLPLR